MKNKLLIIVSVIFLLILTACGNSSSQADGDSGDYPKEPINLIVPFAAGSNVDMILRIIASSAEEHLPNKEPIVVVNKAGGQGSVALTELFKSKPDGYTIGSTSAAPLTISPHMIDTQYSYDDFEPVLGLFEATHLFVVNNDAPYDTFDEWLDYVKSQDKSYKFGYAGYMQVMPMKRLGLIEDVDFEEVQYSEVGEMISDLLSNNIDAHIMPIEEVQPHIKDGKVKPIFNITENEIEYDIPSLQDLDYDVKVNFFNGILAPKDTDAEIINILSEAFEKALDDDKVKEQLENIKANIKKTDGEEFKTIIEEAYKENEEIIKSMK